MRLLIPLRTEQAAFWVKVADLASNPMARIDSNVRALLARHPRWVTLLALVTILFFYVGLRVNAIEADPPKVFPWGESMRGELFLEPPAKAFEARNYAMFGSFNTHPLDEYQFWRTQAPVWVYSLAAFFSTFGTSYASLRVFSTLFSAIGLVALALLAARHAGARGILVAGIIFSFDFYPLHAARFGLIEPTLHALLLLTFYLLDRAFDDLRWLYAAMLSLIAAFLTKQSAVVFLPTAIIGGCWALILHRRRHGWRIPLRILGFGLVLLIALVMYILRPAYLFALWWNGTHLFSGEDPNPSGATYTIGSVGIHLNQLWEPWRLALIPSALAGVAVVVASVRWLRERTAERYFVLGLIWLASAVASLAVVAAVDRRYDLIVHPPTVVLALWLCIHSLQHPRRLVRIFLVLVLALQFFLGLRDYYNWASRPSYELRNFGRALEKVIGRQDAVIVGQRATPLVLDTPYRTFYVKALFNTKPEIIRALGITHALLLGNEHTGGWLRDNVPRSYKQRELVKEMRFEGKPITLYKWHTADGD